MGDAQLERAPPVPGVTARPAISLEFVSPTAAEVARPAPLLARLAPLMVVSLAFSAVALAGLLPIERVVVARGRLISTTPTILLQPLEASIVRSFEVRANQVVRAGDLIARLDPTFTGADLASLENQFATLRAEVDRLEAEA
nr:biotin/lipoyl-binding protein [Rubritepida sp.]